MSELISGKEALIALANGKEVQIWNGNIWLDVEGNYQINVFFKTQRKFRFKPRPILINGIEVPAPFEPKDGEDCRCYYISTTFKHGFDWYHSTYHEPNKIAWRTEDEIEQVVSVLRSVFKGEIVE